MFRIKHTVKQGVRLFRVTFMHGGAKESDEKIEKPYTNSLRLIVTKRLISKCC